VPAVQGRLRGGTAERLIRPSSRAGRARLCARLVEVSTIDSLLRAGRDQHPAVAVPDGPVLSYAQLREMVHDASLRLASFGVQANDRVAIVFPNGPEAIVLFLAVAGVATACPLNPGYKEAEFRYYLEDTGARFLLVPRGDVADARTALPEGAVVIDGDIDEKGRLSMETPSPTLNTRVSPTIIGLAEPEAGEHSPNPRADAGASGEPCPRL